MGKKRLTCTAIEMTHSKIKCCQSVFGIVLCMLTGSQQIFKFDRQELGQWSYQLVRKIPFHGPLSSPLGNRRGRDLLNWYLSSACFPHL